MNIKKIIKCVAGLGAVGGIAYAAYKFGECNGEANAKFRDKYGDDLDDEDLDNSYMCEKHPEVNCKYVIRKSSGAAYDIIMKLGKKPIETSSFAHYISYLASKWNISNHKNGNTNQIFFYILHVSLGLIKNRVFLQHGITKDDAPWLYYKNTKFRYYICGAQREYEYIKKTFGYPENHVVLTGFPRFDTLIDESRN